MSVSNTQKTVEAEPATTVMNFKLFKTAVAAQFKRMCGHPLFRTETDKDEMWALYLSSFPPGTNPMFRKKTEHDCSGCRQFIRAIGNVVAIINGKPESLWDCQISGKGADSKAYQVVADKMAGYVKSKPIIDIFLHSEKTAGVDKNFEQIVDGGATVWEHFFANVPTANHKPGKDIPTLLNGPRANHDVFLRSLTELTDEAVSTTLDLIAQNSLYRGAEFKAMVQEFGRMKNDFAKLNNDLSRDIFAWTANTSGAISRIRNSAIGTLLIDLSAGMDIEEAVKKFESVMAPANYKRPTALVTKAMIEKAKAKVAELGLTSALERRFANLRDITANNVLFADRAAKKVMGDVFDDLAAATSNKAKAFDRIEEVPIEKFLADILPRAGTLDVLFEGKHAGNLVSLIAPVDPTAGELFKWPNRFSWSYSGNVADSIKERVKKAGGNVTGDVCCRLAWDNTDDLDFHMREPVGGAHIFYQFRRVMSPFGGCLDLDANGADGMRTDPAENIYYSHKSKMKDGTYHLSVHQFARRNSDSSGFEVEVDVLGTIHHFVYDKPVRQNEEIKVADLIVQKGEVGLVGHLPSTQSSKVVWNIPTQTFHKAEVVLLSPNYWDGNNIGNKHYFFMLSGCRNSDGARGFYNEFLKESLTDHRKVLEIVGGKMKVADTEDQLSGLGFSSTQKNSLVAKVGGNFNRTIKIVF